MIFFEQDGGPASWLKASKMMRQPELQPENVEPNTSRARASNWILKGLIWRQGQRIPTETTNAT